MNTHTPGPWVIDAEDNLIHAADARHTVICNVGNMKNHGIAADARLIAAAPELLAALQMLTRGYGVTFHDQALRSFAKEAIDKATGGTT